MFTNRFVSSQSQSTSCTFLTDNYCGYFSGQSGNPNNSGNFVLPCGINGQNAYTNTQDLVNNFPTEIHNYLTNHYSGCEGNQILTGLESTPDVYQGQLGAAFIILSMLGQGQESSLTPYQAIESAYVQFDNWKSLFTGNNTSTIISYDATILYGNNSNNISNTYSSSSNTYYYSVNTMYGDPSLGFPTTDIYSYNVNAKGSTSYLKAIVFGNTGTSSYYVIKYFCGNPIGSLSPIIPGANNIQAYPYTTNTSYVYPGEKVSFNPYIFEENVIPSISFNLKIQISTSFATLTGSTAWNNISNPGYTFENSSYQVSNNAKVGSSICITASIPSYQPNPPPNGATITVGSPYTSCATVIDFPFFQVNGSDTQVGLGFCGLTKNAESSIYSWNHNGLSNSYSSGSGSQYATIATGLLSGFDSANINNGTNPLGLSFSNINNPPSNQSNDNFYSGNFGGMFAAMPTCGYNYFPSSNILSSLTSPPGYGSIYNGSYYIDNNNNTITILGINANRSSGTNEVIYVKGGTVNITGNISLNNSSATSINQINSFKLVVLGGNIVIAPNVTKLDGVFIAEPSSNGSSGAIYTCGATQPTTNCNSQLIVNGSLDANKIHLWRTYSTVGQSPAEIINQPPTTWLSSLNSPGPLAIDSIQNLPPVF